MLRSAGQVGVAEDFNGLNTLNMPLTLTVAVVASSLACLDVIQPQSSQAKLCLSYRR